MPLLSRIFALEYRLSNGPPFPIENPFPAALIDAVASYHYLVNTLGFQPINILVMGDSAGGGLAVNLVRYIISNVPSQPPPGALLLASPTGDWGTSQHSNPEGSFARHRNTDFVYPFFLSGYPARALLGNLPLSALDTNSWISPSSHHLPNTRGTYVGFPPTLITAGSLELTLDGIKVLRQRMEEDIGEKVTYY